MAPRAARSWRPALAVAAALAVVASGVAGYATYRALFPTVRLSDDTGVLSVTVPRGWSGHVSGSPWKPPASRVRKPGLFAGTRGSFGASSSTSRGVFTGLLPAVELPTRLPQHPECTQHEDPVEHVLLGDPVITMTSTGCPGDTVVIERVVQMPDDQLLWVQVRAGDRTEAKDVLGSVIVREG